MTEINNAIPQTKESQSQITPDMALQMLIDGNERFVNGNGLERKTANHVENGKSGQWPFAAVLGCIDSRAPVETIFDQGIGDIFCARVAGNIVDGALLGSIEYATAVAGSKLIMVLGHTGCGAVNSAIKGVVLGNITELLGNILPAVREVEKEMPNDSSNPTFANKVVEANVKLTITNMFNRSQIIKELSDQGKVKVVGAIYDIMTGKVSLVE